MHTVAENRVKRPSTVVIAVTFIDLNCTLVITLVTIKAIPTKGDELHAIQLTCHVPGHPETRFSHGLFPGRMSKSYGSYVKARGI